MTKYVYEITKDLKLRTIRVLDSHNLNEGATQESYLCVDENGHRFTCSKDMYSTTERKAWEKIFKEYNNAVTQILNRIIEDQKKLKEIKEKALQIHKKLL